MICARRFTDMWKRIHDLIMFRLLSFASRCFANYVYVVNSGLLKDLKRKGGLGFIPRFKLTAEEKFLLTLNLKDKVVFDVGAFIGLFALFFARAVGEKGMVVAFEPNPELCNKIRENLLLNNLHNFILLQLALGQKKGKEVLVFPSSIPGVGSIEKHERMRILQQKNVRTIEVEIDTVDNLIETGKIPIPDFVKIDVQGAEFEVIKGMSNTIKDHKPNLMLEVHAIPYINWKVEVLRRLVEFLRENGYSIYHIESGRAVYPNNLDIVKADEHLWCV